jgi:hypothetical protein
MKNIQENIYRVKSLMNLLVEDDVTPNTQIPKLDPESLSKDYPVFLKDESLNILEDNRYYLGGKWYFNNGSFRNGQQEITYYKDEILTITIKFLVRNNKPGETPWSEIFNVLNTATIENRNNFGEESKSILDILLKDFIKNITLIHLYVDKYKKMESVTIHVKNSNNEKFDFSIYDTASFVYDFENYLDHKVENGKIILTSVDGKVLDFEPNKPTTTPTEPITEPTTQPTTEPKSAEEPKTTETPQYPSENNFLSIADDIYQDLIKGIIPNVKIVSSDKMTYNADKTKLDSIEFVLQIGGVDFKAAFSEDGLYLEKVSPKKQVRAIWDGKELKYRNIKASELGDKNKLLRLQPDLTLSEQIRILKKYIDKLYLI